jgi:hypothetical protein
MTVGLVPQTAGPYVQGTPVSFNTTFTNNTADPMVMRLFQFSSSASDVAPIIIGADPEPRYKFSPPVTAANSWTIFGAFPIPQAAWGALYFDNDPESEFYNGNQAVLIAPGGTFTNNGTGSPRTGAFRVNVPTFDPGCDPEVYWATTFDPTWCDYAKVDIVTGNGNPDQSGRLRANFDTPGYPAYDMTLANGGLQGGMGWFYVLPEPASLGLLGLGMLVVLRRRR